MLFSRTGYWVGQLDGFENILLGEDILMFFENRLMGGHLEVFKNTLLGRTFSGFRVQATGEYNWRFSRTGYWG